MDALMAEFVLDVVRRSLGLSVGVVCYKPCGLDAEWRIDATAASGERWIVAHPEYAGAVMLLTEAVRFDLLE